MRQLIFAAIILIVIATAWVFYLQHTDTEFESTLPEAPAPSSDLNPAPLKPLETQPAPQNVQQVAPAELPTPVSHTKEKIESLSTVEAYTQKLYEDMTSELIETPIALTDSDDTTDSQPPKPWLKPITEMSLTEITAEVKRRRQALIDTFGDTPEVALINKYTTVESLRDGRVSLDREDGLAYIQAISVLWPMEENIQIVKEFQEMQRNGWHASSKAEFRNLPGIE